MKEFIFWVTILTITMIIFALCSGCSGTGFEKRTTLVPDSIGIALYQARYREEDAAYRGFTINATWSLK